MDRPCTHEEEGRTRTVSAMNYRPQTGRVCNNFRLTWCKQGMALVATKVCRLSQAVFETLWFQQDR